MTTPTVYQQPGTPVMASFGVGLPANVGVGDREPHLRYVIADTGTRRSVTIEANSASWSVGSQDVFEPVPIEDWTWEMLREAAKVATGVADGIAKGIANPVGTYRVPSDEEIVTAIREARRLNIVAWAWSVLANRANATDRFAGCEKHIAIVTTGYDPDERNI